MATKKSTHNTTHKSTLKSKLTKTKARGLHATRRHVLIGFGILVLLWAALGIAVNNRSLQAKLSQLPKQNATTRLESISWSNVGDDKAASKALDGYKYIGVDATIRNISQSPIWYAPVLQSYVKDAAGRRYGIEMVVFNKPLPGGQYESNQQASGELGYMVPVKDAVLTWCFESKQGDKQTALCQPLVANNKKL